MSTPVMVKISKETYNTIILLKTDVILPISLHMITNHFDMKFYNLPN